MENRRLWMRFSHRRARLRARFLQNWGKRKPRTPPAEQEVLDTESANDSAPEFQNPSSEPEFQEQSSEPPNTPEIQPDLAPEQPQCEPLTTNSMEDPGQQENLPIDGSETDIACSNIILGTETAAAS